MKFWLLTCNYGYDPTEFVKLFSSIGKVAEFINSFKDYTGGRIERFDKLSEERYIITVVSGISHWIYDMEVASIELDNMESKNR